MQKVMYVTMRHQDLPRTIPLIWQLNTHKHIGSIPELLRCHTGIVVTLHTLNFRVWRKSNSLLDDLCIYPVN